MKKVIMFLALAFILNVSFAQTSIKATENLWSTIKVDPPKIIDGVEWEKLEQDLGKIEQDKPVEVKYELTNRNKTPLIIKNVKAPCGCTTTGYSKEAIQPGESTTVIATYNAKAKGVFHKSIQVTTNFGEPISLKFTGEVLGK